MLYKFKSKNAGDVIMLEPNGRKILEIIGKDAGVKGIILPEQMPAAIAAIHSAIALEESHDGQPGQVAAPSDSTGLRQRAMPFVDMLKRNYQSGDDVVWGV